MPSESSPDLKFEIGHVLFIDIVGYSKLLLAEESNQIQTLGEIVRRTEQYKKAEAEGNLLRLPTGDGGALVFRNSLAASVLCALEISKALKSHPELKVPSFLGIYPGLNANGLKLDTLWDEPRNDPRFDKIIAEAAKPIKLD